MENFSKQKWEDLNLSRDEVKSIGEALQKEEFRSLLLEYVKEINDPENRKQYEKEITQLENERGVDIKFVHPSPGYVIKTSVNGKSKAFINICSNSNVERSSTSNVQRENCGSYWSIPYCLAPPREDVDKKSIACTVYDVVFHPDTLHQTKNNVAFKKLVDDTALEAVEKNFHVSLDKINLKFPKIQFKGVKHATVIRRKIKDFQTSELIDIPNYPYPPVKEDTQPELKSESKQKYEYGHGMPTLKTDKYSSPKFRIIHRDIVDIQNYTNDPKSKMNITIPNELVIEVELPLLKKSTDASIDVTENSLYVCSYSPAKYKLNLDLPYIVDTKMGNAKFDTSKKLLTITLPVIKQKIYSNVDLAREDSGVESDNCYGHSNNMSSGDEDSNEKENVNRIKTGNELSDKCKMYKNSVNHKGKFLKSNVHYILPNFTCHLFGDLMAFTIQVPNVSPESVEYCFINNFSGFHLTFMNMGTGFFPVHYAMCVLLQPSIKIKNESLSVEVWDNNVIAQVTIIFNDTMYLSEYYAGIDENNVQRFTPAFAVKHEHITKEKEVTANSLDINSEDCETSMKENSTEVTVSDNVFGDDNAESTSFLTSQHDELKGQYDEEGQQIKKQNEEFDESLEEEKELSAYESASSLNESSSSPHRQPAKYRSVSESMQGEVKHNRNRGILKIGRSLSESSVDDYVSWSTEKLEKTKKTVRFSEVISKQTFRMNSSILGQRKKNQRKMRNKKRAQERRLSESGNESEGENEITLIKGKNCTNRKEIDIWLKDPESSSCDASEISEVSDVSESDDGQREEGKPYMPCSSKKNHKRRGKKSARKNAATAKFQIIEN